FVVVQCSLAQPFRRLRLVKNVERFINRQLTCGFYARRYCRPHVYRFPAAPPFAAINFGHEKSLLSTLHVQQEASEYVTDTYFYRYDSVFFSAKTVTPFVLPFRVGNL